MHPVSQQNFTKASLAQAQRLMMNQSFLDGYKYNSKSPPQNEYLVKIKGKEKKCKMGASVLNLREMISLLQNERENSQKISPIGAAAQRKGEFSAAKRASESANYQSKYWKQIN